MVEIRPIRGLRPKPALVGQVASPPYDVLSTEEARAMAKTNPYSFLHVNKPEIDLPPGTDPYAEIVYTTGRETLQRLIREEILIQDPEPAIYIYRLTWRGHTQTAFFCGASVADYDAGRIKKHEFTRADKEADRTKLIDVLGAQTGPVFLTYKSDKLLDSILDETAGGVPAFDFTAADAVRHQLWVMSDRTQIGRTVEGFRRLAALYVADGHHRSAAASQVHKLRKQRIAQPTGQEPYNYFLAAIFPHDHLRILPYNRVVKDLNGNDRDAFLRKVESKFKVQSAGRVTGIAMEHHFAMYLQGAWHTLEAQPGSFPESDPLGSLDINILMENLLVPVLGIGNPRTDKRIDFVGGIRGTEELERLVDSGRFAVAFAMYPTSIERLLAVADSGQVMPPKSTWFEPKLRDGLVTHLL